MKRTFFYVTQTLPNVSATKFVITHKPFIKKYYINLHPQNESATLYVYFHLIIYNRDMPKRDKL